MLKEGEGSGEGEGGGFHLEKGPTRATGPWEPFLSKKAIPNTKVKIGFHKAVPWEPTGVHEEFPGSSQEAK